MLDRHFILHLTLLDGIGPAIIQAIMDLKRSDVDASDLYSFSVSEWMNKCGFSEHIARTLTDGLAHKKSLEITLQLIEIHNIQWVTIADPTYPQLLREIYLPPSVLYWFGGSFEQSFPGQALTKQDKKIAIVGSRKADMYGYRAVNALVVDLVAANYTIVSGGALGIDAAAHEITIKNGGKTIAVLGSGLLRPSLTSHKKLFKAIVDSGGLVVSSFPLSMEGYPGNFPARNRIITGLSHGCVVIQAAQKSGALISAQYAMEQGREVFAVPGPFDHELSVGCNNLIQQGAKLVMSSADILTEFGDRVILPNPFPFVAHAEPVEGSLLKNEMQQTLFKSATVVNSDVAPIVLSVSKNIVERPSVHEIYSESQKEIIRVCKQPSSLDDIIGATQLSLEIVQSELFNLQLDGCIEQDFTGMWVVT